MKINNNPIVACHISLLERNYFSEKRNETKVSLHTYRNIFGLWFLRYKDTDSCGNRKYIIIVKADSGWRPSENS